MNASYHINHLFIPPIRFDNIDLIQIGRRFCSPDTVVPKHLHLNWFELTIATNGKGILTTNDEDIEIKRGDIYLSFPADEHAIRSDPTEPLAYNFISIYPNNPEQLQPLEQLMLAFRDPKSRMFSDEKILFLVDNTLAEFNSDITWYAICCRLLLPIYCATFPKRCHPTVAREDLQCFASISCTISTHIFSQCKI